MSQILIKWYRSATLGTPDPKIMDKRQKALTAFSDAKIDELLEVTRLYLGKPLTSNNYLSTFEDYFTAEDEYFEPAGNDLELRILAGAVVHNKINEKSSNWISVALALKTGAFLTPSAEIINNEIISFATEQLSEESKRIRANKDSEDRFDAVDLVEPLEKVEANQANVIVDVIKSMSYQLEADFNAIKFELKAVKEESNIHWWLFRNMNNFRGCNFSEIDAIDIPFVTAIDLATLTIITPMPVNYLQFLKKSIGENVKSGNFKNSLRAYIENAKNDLKEKFGKADNLDLNNLCPLTFAFRKNLESDNQAGWNAAFEKASSIKVDSETNALDIAEQSYLEQLLVKEIKK